MSVTNEKVLKKMEAELSLALANDKMNSKKMMQHVMKIHLLCELILDDDHFDTKDQKMISMLSEQVNTKHIEKVVPQPSIDHHGANGESIFDF